MPHGIRGSSPPCSVEDCGRRNYARGWCKKHYAQWWNHLPHSPKEPVKCSVDGCPQPVEKVKVCAMHYRRWKRHKSFDNPRPSSWDRFMSKVSTNGPIATNRPDLGPCWLWKRKRLPNGYTQFWAEHKMHSGHRFAYTTVFGPVPDGLVLDHFACDNGAGGCVNPWHCRPATHAENTSSHRRVNGAARRWSHCLVTDCPDTVRYRGLCQSHYNQARSKFRKAFGPDVPMPPDLIIFLGIELSLDTVNQLVHN